MRPLLRAFSILGVALTMVACGDGARGVFGDAQWQVRCPVGFPMCPGAGDAVDIFDFNEDNGVRATCDILESGDDRIVSFQIGRGSDPLLAVSGIVTGVNGGPVRGDACRLTVVDDVTPYGGVDQGRCGANPPSPAQPCQIGPITFDRDAMDGPEMKLTVLCIELPAAADPTRLKRDVTKPLMDMEPANIRLIHCDGI